MDTEKKLAIVIPAYKEAFFSQAIESIANQTCKDFTLYIGDDASPYNLFEIVALFKEQIEIKYKRFTNNLGKDDLVAHWNRCIDMTENEKWIWLFSDDDLMDNTCVETFYTHIQRHQEENLLHFNIEVIDENNQKLYKTKSFPAYLSTADFFTMAIKRKIYSCAVEYIFTKDLFNKVKRFEPFDLAWSADNATWMKLSLAGGIHTIQGAEVKWRFSHLNISSLSSNKNIVLRKAHAGIKYLVWAKQFFKENNKIDKTTDIDKVHWLLIGIVYTNTLTVIEKYKLIDYSLIELNMRHIKLKILAIWIYEELKKSIKTIISYTGK